MHGIAYAIYTNSITKSLGFDVRTLFIKKGLINKKYSIAGIIVDNRDRTII